MRFLSLILYTRSRRKRKKGQFLRKSADVYTRCGRKDSFRFPRARARAHATVKLDTARAVLVVRPSFSLAREDVLIRDEIRRE